MLTCGLSASILLHKHNAFYPLQGKKHYHAHGTLGPHICYSEQYRMKRSTVHTNKVVSCSPEHIILEPICPLSWAAASFLLPFLMLALPLFMFNGSITAICAFISAFYFLWIFLCVIYLWRGRFRVSTWLLLNLGLFVAGCPELKHIPFTEMLKGPGRVVWVEHLAWCLAEVWQLKRWSQREGLLLSGVMWSGASVRMDQSHRFWF